MHMSSTFSQLHKLLCFNESLLFFLIYNSLCLLFCNSMSSELNEQCISYTCVSFMVAHNFNRGTIALQMVWLLVLR